MPSSMRSPPSRTTPYTFTILGEAASKSNSRRIVTRFKGTGSSKRLVPKSIKSEKAMAFIGSGVTQVEVLAPMFEGDVHLDIDIYYSSRRPDLDETLVLDLLQGRIYANDRQVKSRRTRWGLDKLRPRVEITVRPCTQGDLAGE